LKKKGNEGKYPVSPGASHPFYKKGNEGKYPVSPGASHPFYKKGNEAGVEQMNGEDNNG